MTRRPNSGFPPVLTPIAKPELNALIAAGRADPAATRTLRCRTVARGRFTQLNYIRDLPPQPVAESESEGLLNEDVAPNASEALLAAFGSCLAIGIRANAIARNIPIRRLELIVEADIDTTTIWGTGDTDPKPIGFEAIRVSVHVEAQASSDSLDALIKHATLWSPVANTLRNPVHLDVSLAASAARTA